MSDLQLGVIGNGSIAALVDKRGKFVWMCLPRVDGAPIFNSILGGDGQFEVELSGQSAASHRYERNTAILYTVLESEDGSAIEICDFAPRFRRSGRMFRPASFARHVRPLRGAPKIRVHLKPCSGWNGEQGEPVRGVSHISYANLPAGFRVTTDAPVSYVLNTTEFILENPISFVFGPDEPLTEAPDAMCRDWHDRTADYWRQWSRRLHVPLEWQEAVIRAAITLKMCVYEETGGIVAALTTSIPEHAGSERNWDYRYCWLRDAYFTVTALNRLSATDTLERHLSYLRNVVAHTKGGHIQPVFGIGLETDLSEEIIAHLPGYRSFGPVRNGNQAAEHIQHDVYGHVILAAAQAFFDDRLLRPAGLSEFKDLEVVGERAAAMYDQPDAGIWEYRTRASVHTSSSLMCWAACDRLAKIATKLGESDRAEYWRTKADLIHQTISERAWNEDKQAFAGSFEGEELDASVLLMAEVGFLPPDDPRFVATVDAVGRELRHGPHIFRYKAPDDFGTPVTAFTACTFWYIEALARIGRREEARGMFEEILSLRTSLGLLSEDIDIKSGELWGNFPQTYSLVGIINAASRLSDPWDSRV